MSGDDRLWPVPTDDHLAEKLRERIQLAIDEASEFLEEYRDVVEYSKGRGEPEEFAYARLLNHLAEVDNPRLIKILSAFIYVGAQLS